MALPCTQNLPHVEVGDDNKLGSLLRVVGNGKLAFFGSATELDAVAVRLISRQRYVQAVKAKSLEHWSPRSQSVGALLPGRTAAIKLVPIALRPLGRSLLAEESILVTGRAGREPVIVGKLPCWTGNARRAVVRAFDAAVGAGWALDALVTAVETRNFAVASCGAGGALRGVADEDEVGVLASVAW